MRRFALLVAGVALLAGVAATVSGGATRAEARWVITDLGTLPGGGWSTAAAINDRGQVVGESDSSAGWRAFLWERGEVRSLGVLRSLSYSHAADINNRGQIVGWSYEQSDDLEDCHQRAVLWEHGRIRPLAGPKAHAGEAWAINDRGEIVGWVDSKVSTCVMASPRAVVWRKGTMRSLGTLPGDKNSQATGINERTLIVGVSGYVDPEPDFDMPPMFMYERSGFVWERGTMLGLGALAARGETSIDPSVGWINAANDKGQVVGVRRRHATVWENGRPRDLASIRGELWSVATDINNRGQIVGWVSRIEQTADGRGDVERAALWENGKLTLLPGFFGNAFGINERGQIVGSVFAMPDDHAALWTLKRG